jgi:hypothetical protein
MFGLLRLRLFIEGSKGTAKIRLVFHHRIKNHSRIVSLSGTMVPLKLNFLEKSLIAELIL